MLTTQEWEAVLLSVKVASVAVLVNLPLAIILGYFLTQWKSSSKWILETLINIPLVLPPVVTGYLLLLFLGSNGPLGNILENTLGFRIIFTWHGAALAGAIVSFPLMVRAIRLSFQGVDSKLEEAARSLGRGPIATFGYVSLPLAFRGVLAGSVLGFARALGEFGATIMVAGNIPGVTQTIPLAIFSLVQSPSGVNRSTRLVLVSLILAGVMLAISEALERREERRELS